MHVIFLVWTDMCQHVKNIEMFGVSNPSRKERRKLCRKSSSSQGLQSDTETSGDENHSAINNSISSKVCIVIFSILP